MSIVCYFILSTVFCCIFLVFFTVSNKQKAIIKTYNLGLILNLKGKGYVRYLSTSKCFWLLSISGKLFLRCAAVIVGRAFKSLLIYEDLFLHYVNPFIFKFCQNFSSSFCCIISLNLLNGALMCYFTEWYYRPKPVKHW